MLSYVLLHKAVGETPLQVLQKYQKQNPQFANIPLAYAGRLDPMASGKLLVLIGEECKVQEKYHTLDKAYRFEVMFDTSSDTQDILGLLKWKNNQSPNLISKEKIIAATKKLTGNIALPYPIFSSKTVRGKALHTWALEQRLAEIEIPVSYTKVYKLFCERVTVVSAEEVYETALAKINSIPEVTEESKALGRDFRRAEIRLSWKVWLEHHKDKTVTIGQFYCLASAGTYMRSLAARLGRLLQTDALAYSINRVEIGRYQPLPLGLGFWKKRF